MRKPIFSPQRYLQTSSEHVQAPTGKRGKREWLMARGLCHYQCFDLSDLSPLRREEILQLKIRQWSPFAQTASYIAWFKGKAQVWIWDHALQQNAQQTQEIKPLSILPESALRPNKPDTGVQVFQTTDGIEAQIWQQGVLHSSRWWQHVPDNTTWQRFLRSNAQSYTPLPEMIPAPELLAKPWAKNKSTLHNLNLLWRQERLWVALGLSLLLSIFIWEWQSIQRWEEKNAALEITIEQLGFEAEPVLKARNRVLSIKQDMESIQQLDIYPSQLKLLHAVASQLPEGAILQEWKYEAGELRLQIKAKEIDPREYVTAFQSIEYFDEVKPESGRKDDEIQIQMRILPTK